MIYFLDTEFAERGRAQTLELISIGIVAEDGREFYGVNTHFYWKTASDWLVEHVRPHLDAPAGYGAAVQGSVEDLAKAVLNFIGDDTEPIFWGYYSDFDWVIFSQMFGTFADKPAHFPMRCNDLRQALDAIDFRQEGQTDDAPHNALLDARWVRAMYQLYFESP